jgi:peptidoglycan hydrolase CwlO-like protein
MDRRQVLLAGLILAYTSIGVAGGLVRGQDPVQQPTMSQPSRPDQEPSPENPSLANPEKKVLEDNDKDIKKKVEKLYQLVSELKSEVDKTDSSKVMSLNLIKKTEEIEKLARDIRNRSKG